MSKENRFLLDQSTQCSLSKHAQKSMRGHSSFLLRLLTVLLYGNNHSSLIDFQSKSPIIMEPIIELSSQLHSFCNALTIVDIRSINLSLQFDVQLNPLPPVTWEVTQSISKFKVL